MWKYYSYGLLYVKNGVDEGFVPLEICSLEISEFEEKIKFLQNENESFKSKKEKPKICIKKNFDK